MANAVAQAVHQFLQPTRYRWWHAVIFWLLANLPNALSAGVISDDAQQRKYNSRKQAPFAPPGWLFGPAWTINNVSVLIGNIILLNKPEGTPGRKQLLWAQAVSWFIYATFTYVYFTLDSPILAFIWTFGMFLLTIYSVYLALKIDAKIALSLATLTAWLALASPVAAYQVAYNKDDLFNTPAPVK